MWTSCTQVSMAGAAKEDPVPLIGAGVAWGTSSPARLVVEDPVPPVGTEVVVVVVDGCPAPAGIDEGTVPLVGAPAVVVVVDVSTVLVD